MAIKKMLAFHNDTTIKQKYVDRVKEHQRLDHIAQGVYYETGGEKPKMCGVGCTIHGNDHKKYETELGIPEEIAHLEDIIFEELSNEKAKDFPLRFLEAIPVGADLSHVIPQLVIWQFEDGEYGLKNIQEVKDDKEAYGFCEEVVALYKRELKGKKPTQAEYQELYEKIDWSGAWAWAWAGAGAGAYTALADKFIELLTNQENI